MSSNKWDLALDQLICNINSSIESKAKKAIDDILFRAAYKPMFMRYIDKAEFMEETLQRRGYVLTSRHWIKNFTFVKLTGYDSFIIGHDLPGNKQYVCKSSSFTGLLIALDYFERI